MHEQCKGDYESLRTGAGLSKDELTAYLNYAAQFLGNGGNFKSFGDSKFIPRLPQRQLKALATCSKRALECYEKTGGAVFAAKDEAGMLLGFPESGHVSGYYPDSPEITRDEIETVSKFVDGKGLLPENTRLRKCSKGNFKLLIASAQADPASSDRDVKEAEFKLDGALAGKTLKLVYGDHDQEMDNISLQMLKAKDTALNSTEQSMCDAYSKSFGTGECHNTFIYIRYSWFGIESFGVEIVPPVETGLFMRLAGADNTCRFIKRLP